MEIGIKGKGRSESERKLDEFLPVTNKRGEEKRRRCRPRLDLSVGRRVFEATRS
jgi:hypothetical protein